MSKVCAENSEPSEVDGRVQGLCRELRNLGSSPFCLVNTHTHTRTHTHTHALTLFSQQNQNAKQDDNMCKAQIRGLQENWIQERDYE